MSSKRKARAKHRKGPGFLRAWRWTLGWVVGTGVCFTLYLLIRFHSTPWDLPGVRGLTTFFAAGCFLGSVLVGDDERGPVGMAIRVGGGALAGAAIGWIWGGDVGLVAGLAVLGAILGGLAPLWKDAV